MICRISIKNIIDTITAMSALYNLTLQQAKYLQTHLPKNYSLQTVSTDTKRQRSARKMDDIFTDVFGPTSKKSNKQKITNNSDNSQMQVQPNSKLDAKESNRGKNSSEDFIESRQQKKKEKPESKKGINELCISKILQKLKIARCSWPFRQPVDPISQGVPNYLQIIKQPMDLQTIEKKLKNGGYFNDEEFHQDVNKIITNSFTFNPKETNYYKLTKQFETIYKQAISEVSVGQQNLSKKNLRQKKIQQEKQNINNKYSQQISPRPTSLRLHKAEKLTQKEREKLFHQLYGLSQQKIARLIKIFDNGSLQSGWKQFQIDFKQLKDDQYDQIIALLKES